MPLLFCQKEQNLLGKYFAVESNNMKLLSSRIKSIVNYKNVNPKADSKLKDKYGSITAVP